jgi:hypothetical protein
VWGDEVNGWFSRINAQTGQVASGAGEVFVDGRSLGFGHLSDWFDGQTLLVKGHGDRPTLINVHTGERQELTDYAVNQAAGGGGSWMGTGGSVIWCAVSRTGERAWIEERGGNDDRSLFVDGLPIVQFQPINYCRISDGYVTWSFFARGKREVWGKRPGHGPERLNVFSGDSLFAVPVLTSLGPFVVVQSHTALHVAPWGENRGTLIATGNDKNFHPDAAWTPQGLLVVWNDDRGEQGRQFIDLTKRDSLELDVVPSTPLPIPPVIAPDPEIPVPDLPDYSVFVRDFFAPRLKRIEGDEDLTRAHSFDALNACADALHRQDARVGLLKKTGGAQVRDRAADVIAIDLGNGTCQLFDAISDAEGHDGTPRADWRAIEEHEAGIRPIDQWRAPFPVGTPAPMPEPTPTPTPTPQPPPATGCTCAAEVAKIREDITALTDMLLMLPANLAGLVEQIMEEKLSERPAPEPSTSFPAYEGRIFGQKVRLEPK